MNSTGGFFLGRTFHLINCLDVLVLGICQIVGVIHRATNLTLTDANGMAQVCLAHVADFVLSCLKIIPIKLIRRLRYIMLIWALDHVTSVCSILFEDSDVSRHGLRTLRL